MERDFESSTERRLALHKTPEWVGETEIASSRRHNSERPDALFEVLLDGNRTDPLVLTA